MTADNSRIERLLTGSNRATVPLIGLILLCALVVLLAASAGISLVEMGTATGSTEPITPASIALSVEDNTLHFTHEHGEALDVHALTMQIRVDGEPLERQPPLPFFAASGFESGPTGPFNSASDPTWEVGESASLTVASSNTPTLDSGTTVSVRLYRHDDPLVTLETTV